MPRLALAPGTYGEISARSLGAKGWEARVYYRTLAGDRRGATRRGRTKAEAVNRLREALNDLVKNTGPSPTRHTLLFKTLAEEWRLRAANRVDVGDLATGTFEEYVGLLNRVILPRFGDRPLRDVTTREVSSAYEEWHAKWKAQARAALTVLRQVMALGARLGYIESNPVALVSAYKREDKPIFAPEPTDLATFRRHIVAYAQRPNRSGPEPGSLLLDIVDVILGTGLRIGEALGLRWHEDVFLPDRAERAHIVVNGAVKEAGGVKRWEPRTKTDAGYRVIDIPPHLVELFERRRAEQRIERGAAAQSAFVFHTRTGRPNGQQDVQTALRRVRAWAGLPEGYVPHALRRSVATQVADELGLEAAAKLLGHKRSRVTEQHYAKRRVQTPDVTNVLGQLHTAITDPDESGSPEDGR